MRTLFIVIFGYAVLMCVIYLYRIGRPSAHDDRDVARFLAAQGWADLTTNGVLLLASARALHGHVATGLFVAALTVQGAVYTWRLWLSRGMPRGKIMSTKGGNDAIQDRS